MRCGTNSGAARAGRHDLLPDAKATEVSRSMRVLSVSLFADVWPHSFPQQVLLRELRDAGDEIMNLTCKGEISFFCNAMAARGLTESATLEDKHEVCRSCRKRGSLLRFRSGMQYQDVGDLLDQHDRSRILDYIQGLDRNSWMESKFEGLDVARISAYEFFLHHKLNSTDIPERLWQTFLGYVRSTTAVLLAAKNVIDEWRPDSVVVYNGLYAAHNVVVQYAELRGIQSTAVHAGQNMLRRYSTLFAYDARTLPHLSFQSEEWARTRDEPVPSDHASLVTDHILEIFRAQSRFVYSAPLSGTDPVLLKSRFGIPDGAMVLLATMSSLDEVIAARLAGLQFGSPTESVFTSSLEWIEDLKSLATERPAVFVLVRVHPREFPNKREEVLSENAVRLRERLTSLPANMAINWPDDGVSLYDLASITDVCLNFTSTAGIEMMSLGIPTVLPLQDEMLAYDPAISHLVRDRSGYGPAVDSAIEEGWSVENIRRAYRWWGFVFGRLALDISAAFTYPTGGYLSAVDSGMSRLRNRVLKVLSAHLPPVMEMKDLTGRYRLKDGSQLVRTVHEGRRFMVLPGGAEREKDEDAVLAGELSRLISFFEKSGMGSVSYVSRMRHAVSAIGRKGADAPDGSGELR